MVICVMSMPLSVSLWETIYSNGYPIKTLNMWNLAEIQSILQFFGFFCIPPVYNVIHDRSSRATCPPQVNYLWAVLIVLTDASGGETPWASCCSMLWLLQTPTDSLFCLLPQAHSWISLQIFSAEFFFLNKYNHFVFYFASKN